MTENELATQKMLTKMAEDIAAIKNRVEDDHKAIHGNGQPGLIERVTKLETKVGIIASVASIGTAAVIEIIKHIFG